MIEGKNITVPVQLLAQLVMVANLSRATAINFAPAFAPASRAADTMRQIEAGGEVVAKAGKLLKEIEGENNDQTKR